MRYYKVRYETTPHLFPIELAKKLGIVNTDIRWNFFYANESEHDALSVRLALECHLSMHKYSTLDITNIEEISEQEYLDHTADDEE